MSHKIVSTLVFRNGNGHKQDAASAAKNAVDAIKKAEQAFHTALEVSYNTMGDTTFKALVRFAQSPSFFFFCRIFASFKHHFCAFFVHVVAPCIAAHSHQDRLEQGTRRPLLRSPTTRSHFVLINEFFPPCLTTKIRNYRVNVNAK
jgi:hypothetical protein